VFVELEMPGLVQAIISFEKFPFFYIVFIEWGKYAVFWEMVVGSSL
jgi:hypothetical protein